MVGIATAIRECLHCRLEFRAASQHQDFCSPECRRASELKDAAKIASASVNRSHAVERKHRGDWAEMIACCWLLERGYEVFRNVSSRGPIDVIATRHDKTLHIDVKTVQLKMKTSTARAGQADVSGGDLTKEQIGMGVKALFVSPDGFCSFNRTAIQEMYTGIYKAHLDG